MQEWGPGVYDPLSGVKNAFGNPYRSMALDDVNDLVELAHQPYMYKRQVERFEKRFGDLCCHGRGDKANRSNQQAIAVLRFVLQCMVALSEMGPERAGEIVEFAKEVGNIPERDCYRGETDLRFFSGEYLPHSKGGESRRWLDYRVKVSESYRKTLLADFDRMEASNVYSFFDCMVDACFIDEENRIITDVFQYEGDCYVYVSVSDIFGDKDGKGADYMRCMALCGLIDFLATLHLYEVEVRVDGWRISHQTNTLLAQAWRVAFESLNEITSRNDKYGKRKMKYRVFCCADCRTPRIVKQGKSAVRCPLCSNNNTKEHRSSKRNVY